jgi:hypothetical protein
MNHWNASDMLRVLMEYRSLQYTVHIMDLLSLFAVISFEKYDDQIHYETVENPFLKNNVKKYVVYDHNNNDNNNANEKMII